MINNALTKHKLLMATLLVLITLAMTANHAYASDRKALWPRWQVFNPLSKARIDHTKWQQFLDHNIIIDDEGITLINYTAISKSDIALLNDYINTQEKVKVMQYNRQEQLAYWINLYNALTVKLILEHYPVSSIKDINISPGLFSIGPWSANLIRVDNVALSLNDIHNRIIRPIWNDPRTHYAINNATIGAANLSPKAYSGRQIINQLNSAAKNYINSLRGVQVIDNKLIVSKIYDWFEQDFGSSKQNVIIHLKQFANNKLKQRLSTISTVDGYQYNWHLNNTQMQRSDINKLDKQ